MGFWLTETLQGEDTDPQRLEHMQVKVEAHSAAVVLHEGHVTRLRVRAAAQSRPVDYHHPPSLNTQPNASTVERHLPLLTAVFRIEIRVV